MTDVLLVVFTAALFFMTGWYTLFTYKLSKSAEESAKHARAAAEAAASANVLQRAVLPVDFDIRPLPHRRSDAVERDYLSGVRFRSLGANIWLHGAEIDSYMIWYGTQERWVSIFPLSLKGSPNLPILIQSGEVWEGSIAHEDESVGERTVPLAGLRVDKAEPIVGIRVVIHYSFDRDSPSTAKQFTARESSTP
jgi:hypothetical protein